MKDWFFTFLIWLSKTSKASDNSWNTDQAHDATIEWFWKKFQTSVFLIVSEMKLLMMHYESHMKVDSKLWAPYIWKQGVHNVNTNRRKLKKQVIIVASTEVHRLKF